MEQASRGRQPLAISVTLGLIAATIAWFLVSASSQAEDVDLTTADLVPGDAAVYVGLNTDLDSSEWISAFALVEKLGRNDPEADLRQAFEDEGELDWDKQVTPFLGGNAAFYMRSYDWSGDAPDEFGVIVKAQDPVQAMGVFLHQLDAVGGQELLDYDGQSYSHFQPPDDEAGYIAVMGKHLIITTTEEEMHRVIDVAHERAPSLSDNEDFKKLRDELSGHFLAFVYVDAERLLEGLLGDESIPGFAFVGPTWPADTGTSAFVVGAKDSGFVFQSASGAIPEAYSGMLEPHESRFLGMVPEETAVFVSGRGLGDTIATALDDLGQQFPAIDPSLWNDPDMTEEERQALEQAFGEDDPFSGLSSGFGQAAETARLLTGEVAAAVWLRDGEPTGALMAEIDDEAAVRESLQSLLNGDSY
ncbi:MAG TPA: DUF3352 domain-containing protein, partial [Tepidiformaceae bacterium]|nr:DUF3352 domain-containing protein [Tepidiformaceae bacterium]